MDTAPHRYRDRAPGRAMTSPKPRGGARPGAGRKPGKARSGLRRTLLLSHEAIAVLEAVPERQRGAWVSALIEAAQKERQ